MKKFFLIAMGMLGTGILPAQGLRIATVDVEAVVAAMPETQALESELNKIEIIESERIWFWQEKLNALYKQKSNQSHNAKSQGLYEQELNVLNARIQEAIQATEVQLEAKRMTYLKPLLEKVQAAARETAHENDYAIVLTDPAAVLYGPADDITPAVMARLGLPTDK